jgi:riboflavin synthase
MFTGLIEDLGRIRSMRRTGNALRVEITTSLPLDTIRLGDSIAVNGACLTATDLGSDWFAADASSETVERTALSGLRAGSPVHLERALQWGGRLDGHIVQGHVDGVGQVVRNQLDNGSWQIWIRPPAALLPEICEKGSIAVDGVSLTVNELRGDMFRLTVVPFTTTRTRVHEYRVGDAVNVETDILGKYVRRLLDARPAQSGPAASLPDLLTRYGYT